MVAFASLMQLVDALRRKHEKCPDHRRLRGVGLRREAFDLS
jgi:hypothetical protein